MKSSHWSKEEISSFCLELSLLLKAGFPVDECFSILAEEEKDSKRIELFHQLHKKTEMGVSVYEAMKEADVFPPYMLKMILMGGETGYLEAVFRGLSVYYEERHQMERMLKETIAFPLVLLIMMIAVVMILTVEVLPVFQNVFSQLGGTLSPVALFFMNAGFSLLKGKVFFFVMIILVVFAVSAVVFHENTREKWNRFWKKIFVRTAAGKTFEAAHFAAAIHMGITGGLDTGRALEIAGEFCEEGMQERILNCREQTMMGLPLAEAIAEQNLFKPMYCRMLSVGMKTGALDITLEEISRRCSEEAAEALRKMASKVEPAVVIIMCILVGIVLLSVMFPLVDIMNSL